MARYGVPYRGSKSRIAPWVVDHIPSDEVLVDLFGGGVRRNSLRHPLGPVEALRR